MKKKLVAALALVMTFIMVLSSCGVKAPANTSGSSGAPASQEGFAEKPEVTLMLTQHDPDNSLPGQYCHAWADMVFEKSKGRIKVIVNNGGSIAKPTESLDKVKDGGVDIAWGLQSFYSGQFPMTDGLSLPYLPYTSAAQASDVMMDVWMNTELLQSDSGYSGTKVILIRSNCDAPITTAKKQLETTADFKGMTIRASVAPLVNWLGEFGATGKACPINELFQNLQNGAFDGAVTDWHGIESFRLYDNCAKYFADEQVQYNTYYFLMNQAKYDSLSAENKAVIDACSGQAALELMKDAWDDMKATTTKSIEEAGGTVYKLSDAEHQKLVDAADKVTKQWIAEKGDAGQKLYDKIIELTKQ
ncbi:TRAP-type C4-dicarboxylate transport system, substrate-binding protein [Sporobacter termitidis DSM 10068]|uniref:TRAP-type C4-dicarboxylate transport system, substrate-binding protein n=1 Tax=Sporobacter termitidis DSM 10068 TaxID=1123282 RepID=A0A1M5Y6J0_9FIRM|nr:TRAP transporter substrate-binding protein DctP [Sporobacter termitidis]SHI07434.1 TRAP-type C4-dicarboxylate transport system, substrate-binding protein [Sporobacter termitidis DSM 10068]